MEPDHRRGAAAGDRHGHLLRHDHPLGRLNRLLLAGLLALASTAVAGPAGAQEGAGLGIRLLDAGPDQAGDPRATAYVVDHVAPGGALERRIEVRNGTAAAMPVELYAGGASVGDAGFEFADAGVPGALAGWTAVEPSALTLAPGQAVTATVRVVVPADAPPGEHYGVVWAATSSGAATGVETVNRVGIRMFVNVGTGDEPETDFTVAAIRAGGTGGRSLVAVVRNTGGRAIDVQGEVVLTAGPGGRSAGPFPASSTPTVAVGAQRDVTFPLPDDVPAGTFTARVQVRSGTTERSAEATVTFDAAGPATVGPTTSAGDGRSGTPAAAAAVAGTAAALVLAGIVAVWANRRKAASRS